MFQEPLDDKERVKIDAAFDKCQEIKRDNDIEDPVSLVTILSTKQHMALIDLIKEGNLYQ